VNEIEGDSATGRVAVDCLCTHVEMGPVQISGLYHDRFERRNGRWAIAERRFDLHYLTPLVQWSPVAGSEAQPA
jgi:SnoaL-like protein